MNNGRSARKAVGRSNRSSKKEGVAAVSLPKPGEYCTVVNDVPSLPNGGVKLLDGIVLPISKVKEDGTAYVSGALLRSKLNYKFQNNRECCRAIFCNRSISEPNEFELPFGSYEIVDQRSASL